MNPLVKQYLESKLGVGYEDQQAKELEAARSKAKLGNLFGDLGDVIAGNRVGSTDQFFKSNVDALKAQQAQKKAGALSELDLEKQLKADQADQEKMARENDVNSPESKLAQKLAVELGAPQDVVAGLTASKWKQFSPAYEKMYELRARKEENAMRRAEAGARKQELQQIKIQEKENQLQTPYGLAQTPADAKELKAASEEKANFDRKIDELISLRKQYGGELTNREAVSRAKQLSKDLLLAYKNMAKLGVLSASDEAIINAIIPSNPLEFRSPLAAIQGQDPILNNLQKFRADSDADFNQKLMNRLRQPDQAIKEVNTPQTKEIGGVLYQKVGGGWQKVKKDAGL